RPHSAPRGTVSVASELVARSLVFLVAELAALTALAELLELVRLLRRGEPGGGGLTPAGQAVGVDAELAKPGPQPLDADASRWEGVSAGPGERPPLHVPAIDGQEADRCADLEQQGNEGVT